MIFVVAGLWFGLGAIGALWLLAQDADVEVPDLLIVPLGSCGGPIIFTVAALQWFLPAGPGGRKVLIKHKQRKEKR